MSGNEFLDGEALDPKKLFDEKEYSTLIVDRSGFSKQQNESADLIERLLARDVKRDELEEIFGVLKKNKAQDILISAIRNTEDKKKKARLTAAVWESGVDIGAELLFFVQLACEDDFELAMEALTVIENIDSKLDIHTLESAMQMAQDCRPTNKELNDDLITCLKGLIENT